MGAYIGTCCFQGEKNAIRDLHKLGMDSCGLKRLFTSNPKTGYP
jgi:hypothetical protein